MNMKIYYILSVLFLLNTGMSCEEDYETVFAELAKTESVNIDNTGKNYIAGGDNIKKEAYMIGVEFYWAEKNENGTIDDYKRISNYDKFSNTDGEVKIYCINDFDDDTPAGSDVTSYFAPYPLQKYSDGYGHLLALRRIPKPGVHAFRVVVQCYDDEEIVSETKPVTLY